MPRAHTSILDRFMVKITEQGECHIWTGGTNSGGYGQIGTRDRKIMYAHRFAWEYANRQEVPEGMYVLHSCDTPACVNPQHLRLGTAQENMDDAKARSRTRNGWGQRTKCVKGHPLSGDNLWVNPQTGWRRCLICKRQANRAYMQRR